MSLTITLYQTMYCCIVVHQRQFALNVTHTFKAVKRVEMDGCTSLLLIKDNFTHAAIIVFMVTISVHHITANNNHFKIITSPQLTSKLSL